MHPALLPDSPPSRVALTVGGGSPVSYAELWRGARAHAARLLAGGLRPGDRVAIVTTPELATAGALVGNALAGLVTVPLNPALGARELSHVLADSAPRRVLAADPAALPGAGVPVERIDLSGPQGPPLSPPSPSDPLLVLYTSGTTGAPKGAQLTHDNAAFDLDALAEAWGWTEADVLVHALPLFHVHGLVLGLFGSLRVGGTLQLLPRFTPEALCAAIGGGATMAFGVPTMWHRIAEHLEAAPADAARCGRARLLVSGSAALPAREHGRLGRLLGQAVVERYGLTETLINTAARHDGPRRAGEVGPPLPGVELKLLDELGATLPPGAGLGELAVRGRNVFAGYLNRPDATAAAIDAEGFFHTGDLATVEPDGAIRIAGRRATDLVKTGGYKVGAGEVEGALMEHPSVREAAVIGAPDDDLGERLVAFVVLREGAAVRPEELSEHVAALLAPHKRPREVHLRAALPRNAMGKILKATLATERGRR